MAQQIRTVFRTTSKAMSDSTISPPAKSTCGSPTVPNPAVECHLTIALPKISDAS